ncbi:MAG: oxidoreductase molybdopterin binding [Devosia sp.]|uniref:sulfite oxidase-like oxidoreductase n=1 Tax=Devosia sp. TaxID=1871048 RepID=UPI00262DA035|nr:sulfite oxidase-like oxidoreductase [Devosia sp.]MDB5588041.1 oxidoreductase molybdopterin binding [Devosia sp.]
MPDELPADSKLTRTKQSWAAQGRFITGRTSRPEEDRLPPGQHLVKNWPVLDLGIEPDIALPSWRLDVGGEVDTPMALNWDTFTALPQVENTSDIHCVTSWSRYNNRWNGVSTQELAAHAVIRPEAQFAILTSHDGYTTNLALADFLSEDALLAHSWDRAPLTAEHGGPMRLVVPHLYFWKSPKWLRRIEFATSDHPGFWEVRGYHNHGDPWREQRYS